MMIMWDLFTLLFLSFLCFSVFFIFFQILFSLLNLCWILVVNGGKMIVESTNFIKHSYSVSISSEPEPKQEQEQEPEFMTLDNSMDSVPDWTAESKILSLINQLIPLIYVGDFDGTPFWKIKLLITHVISLVRSMDMESQPKPESEFMSLVTQTISVFNSMDLDSQPEALRKLIALLTQRVDVIDTNLEAKEDALFTVSLAPQIFCLEPEPEILSLIYQIFSLVISIKPLGKLISLCPQVRVKLEKGKFHVVGEIMPTRNKKWECLPGYWIKFRFTAGQGATHYFCRGCQGKNHVEYKDYCSAPRETKHLIHPKHFLQLVLWRNNEETRKCYCCDEILKEIFYYCVVCDFAMNLACVEKPRVVYIDQPKWHEHTLAQFPKHVSLTCNLCALANPTICTFYICPPCAYVVHAHCINLPRVIRISRHPHHRISFTPSFNQGDWLCGVCRREINNDYGGYSCIKDGCSYTAHSKCATQSNVWDGIELEDVPEEIEEEEVEPFVTISDGIIQHFSHQDHHLKFVDNTGRDYDDNNQCKACITPIYFGNFYSCEQCDFILHEACANLSCKIYHPIHQHKLTLRGGHDGELEEILLDENRCSACPRYCTAGFFYACSKEGCEFRLHVQCAMMSEPLEHGSHIHPLFLTSKPGEQRKCSVCGNSKDLKRDETFNCIEECNFALCFECATLPQKVRYKHDRHTLFLSYGEETNSTASWCEACEGEIKPKERFYKCDEYCCVTLHIICLLGKDLYMKPGSSWTYFDGKVTVMPNNHMSRPMCDICEERCQHKIVFRCSGLIACSTDCIYRGYCKAKLP